MSLKLRLGFSPCPNDTFIFEALALDLIDTGDLEFDIVLEDVETLNQMALKGILDISKLSYAVLPSVAHQYRLLSTGSALGQAVGPLLIYNKSIEPELLPIQTLTVAIPGEHTTAHLLFSMAYPEVKNKIFLRYDEIENYVLQGNGPGVIIHENRFTYQEKGLIKITDLGDFWEQKTSMPIPLGGIVVKRSISKSVQVQINNLIRESIEYAYKKQGVLSDYIRRNAQEMTESVMRRHIDLYVNKFSLDLTETGIQSVIHLCRQFGKLHNTETDEALLIPVGY